MIPKILHFVWCGGSLPAWADCNIEEFRRLNPGYDIRVHDESVLLPQYAGTYDRVPRLDSKSDLLRYSALQREGGWYFDVDYWPMRSVDDIVAAHGLTSETFFVTEQHFQRNPSLATANGVLAATKDHPAWAEINARIAAAGMPYHRCEFGPKLLTDLVKERRELFSLGAWPWFYPAGHRDAKLAYRALLDGASPAEALGDALFATSGQLPFVMHLWQGGSTKIEVPAETPAVSAPSVKLDRLRVGLIATNRQWIDPTQPFRAIADGIRRLGCCLQVSVPGKWPTFSEPVDVCILWNGRRELYAPAMEGLRKAGTPVVVLEHGFFDRRNHTQADHSGFNHTASWTDRFDSGETAPDRSRLRRVWPEPLAPVEMRSEGYVLVLGQVSGDTQMYESEVRETQPLLDAVLQAVPEEIDVLVRSHPLSRSQIRLGRACPDGGTLREAIAGARFVVTINSNSGNEALAWGCPVLCLGPALYSIAGAARKTTLAGMGEAIAAMLDGWVPAPKVVDSYLHWLACRQWSRAEFAQGDVLANLIEEAMPRV